MQRALIGYNFSASSRPDYVFISIYAKRISDANYSQTAYMHVQSKLLTSSASNTKTEYLKSFVGQTVYPIENPFSPLGYSRRDL
jgi:hypothetical protein